MRVMRWKAVCGMFGLSIALSGCFTAEQTTTVLEDGRILDQIVLQPKHSWLASLALGSQLNRDLLTAGKFRKHKDFGKFLSQSGDACKVADFILKEVAQQRIPYSSVPKPIKFGFSDMPGNGCSIQIGPYDPRKLPTPFLKEFFGLRVVTGIGLHSPYKLSGVPMDEGVLRVDVVASELEASCVGDPKPELCQDEIKFITNLMMKPIEGMGKNDDLFSELIGDEYSPKLALGIAHILRSFMKDMSVTWVIPNNVALATVRGVGTLTHGQGWLWRGTFLEAAMLAPEVSFEIRPTRPVIPGASSH